MILWANEKINKKYEGPVIELAFDGYDLGRKYCFPSIGFSWSGRKRSIDVCLSSTNVDLMFERKTQSLASRTVFVRRVFWSIFISACVVVTSLGVGTLGYHYFGQLAWLDALLNASMILAGMGPVDSVKTVGGKLFATFYCLFSGIVFLTLLAIILTPIYHRFLHSFHLAEEDGADDEEGDN